MLVDILISWTMSPWGTASISLKTLLIACIIYTDSCDNELLLAVNSTLFSVEVVNCRGEQLLMNRRRVAVVLLSLNASVWTLRIISWIVLWVWSRVEVDLLIPNKLKAEPMRCSPECV
jgi:hypothetical protein